MDRIGESADTWGMKTKFVTLSCVVAILLASAPGAMAWEDGSPEAIAADVLVARPACFVATVVGSGIFVLALPFAALSGTVKKTGRTLVTGPGRLTFSRPVGDFSDFTP
jgi:hypothetical protein